MPFTDAIFIALGANLPHAGRSAEQTCAAALAALAEISGLRLLAASPFYETAPVPASDQPSYVNGVARLEGALSPARLLCELQAIEVAHGRVRGARNAARSLDLDIIAMGEVVRDAPDPVLPHPRAHLRAFVLYPLRDVAPDWIHPRLGLTVGAMIAALPPEAIRRL